MSKAKTFRQLKAGHSFRLGRGYNTANYIKTKFSTAVNLVNGTVHAIAPSMRVYPPSIFWVNPQNILISGLIKAT